MSEKKKRPKSTVAAEATYLPGQAPTKNKKVHAAAVHLHDVRATRMQYTADEKDAEVTLLAYMNEAGITAYKYGDIEVNLTQAQKVKVKKIGDSATEEGGDAS